ncbi:hypothetical protein [Phormidesmis priestleyi]|uniref:hypothetical protein n=1 Tax=Phormidesmis priestleyi TaxID=268141 RepID=UPI00083A0926|nr:hypothetical protein [Phormidesmis priestleyi]
MAKLNPESLESFQSTLETIDPSWQPNFNLREVVGQSFALIKKARGYKVSWEQLAEILKQSNQSQVSISPATLRQYYFEFAKDPKSLPEKRRKPSSTKKKSEDSQFVDSSSKNGKTDAQPPDTNQSLVLEAELDPEQNALQASESQPVLEMPSSEDPVASQPATPNPTQKAKKDNRDQFNLDRRGK